MSMRAVRTRRRNRLARIHSKPRPAPRYLECPCCGHPDCVPDGGLDPDWPELGPRWFDDSAVTCSACRCEIRVKVTDDYAEDARAWAYCRDERSGDGCRCGGAL